VSTGRTIKRRDFIKGVSGLAGVALSGAVAGCAPGTPEIAAPTAAGEGGAATAQPTAAPEATSPPTAAAAKYADDPCDFRIVPTNQWVCPDDQLVFDIRDQAFLEEYNLNARIKYVLSESDEVMELRLQTQETDCVQRAAAWALRWMSTEGLIQDMDKELKEYAPNYLAKMPGAALEYFMRDGLYTGVPTNVRENVTDVDHVAIRRDWLEKIDRDVPTTVEELEECLQLFKDRGLGGDLTIPISTEDAVWGPYVLRGIWAPLPDEQLSRMEAGQCNEIAFAWTMEEGRLDLFQRWFGKGLLNEEHAIWDYETVKDAVKRGHIGALLGGSWIIWYTLAPIEAENPEQDWVMVHPPLGLRDVPNSGRLAPDEPVDRVAVVATWARCPEVLAAMYDWEAKSWDNYLIARYGIEGKHWRWHEDGWIESLISDAPNQEYRGMASIVSVPEYQAKLRELPPEPGTERKDIAYMWKELKNLHTRLDVTKPQQGELPCIADISHWCPVMYIEGSKYFGDLSNLRTEYFNKITKGELEVVAGVQEYWDRWYATGGDVRVREINEQYAKYVEAFPHMKDPKIYFAPEFWDTERAETTRKTT